MTRQQSFTDWLLLQRLDQALGRMEQRALNNEARGYPVGTEHIENLRQKRRLVEAGSYHVSRVDVTPGVREVGRGICNSVKYFWRRPNG